MCSDPDLLFGGGTEMSSSADPQRLLKTGQSKLGFVHKGEGVRGGGQAGYVSGNEGAKLRRAALPIASAVSKLEDVLLDSWANNVHLGGMRGKGRGGRQATRKILKGQLAN